MERACRDLDKNSFESKGWNLGSLLLNESACLEGFDRKPSELRLRLMQNDILSVTYWLFEEEFLQAPLDV
jgi:hypothetical protein